MAGQTLTFLDAQSNALAQPYFEGSRAYLRVVDPAASTSVQVNVSAAMSLDQETLTLAETGTGTGVFQGSVALTNAAPQPDGVLETSRNVNSYPWTFDTLTATYGALSASAAMVGSTVTATNAAGTPVTTYVIGDRIYLRVVDVLADTTPAVDTTTVSLNSSVGFIGEYETLTLSETGPSTAVFTGSIPMVQSSGPIQNDGTVEVLPGSSLRIEHADANGQTYSAIEAIRVLGSQPPSIAWVDDYDQPLSQVYEFSYPRLRATDGTAAGQGNLLVRLSSTLAGDEESISLWEDSQNPGLFYGGMTIWPQAYGSQPGSNGRLEVTVNPGPPVQRDTAIAQLDCPAAPCATASAGVVGSSVRFTDAQRADVSVAILGTAVYVEGVDYYPGQSRLATVTSSSGDRETVYLNPLYSGPNQSPVYYHFSGIVSLQPGPVVQEDSLLQVTNGDTVTVTYPDPSGYGSSTDTVTVASQQVEFLNHAGNPVSAILANGPVRLRVTYPAGNTTSSTADTLTLNVLSWDSFSNVFDTETVTLFETGPNTGVFTGEIPSRMGFSGSSSNGTLDTSNYYPEYDRIEVTLGSAIFSAHILPGIVRFVDASGADITEVTPGANLYVQEEVESPYWSPDLPDTVYVSFRNLTTSDEEFTALTETGPDTRVFQGFIPTALAANAVRYDGALQVVPGETIQANAGSYSTFTDEVVAVQGGLSNLPPVANFDTFTTDDNQSTTFSVTANDTDPENQPITLVAVTQGVLGSVSIVDAALGTILYTPSGLYSGSDSFTYTITDSQGATATGTCAVEVVHVNRPPVAVNDAVSVAEDQAAIFYVLQNDSDPDGDTLAISGLTAATHGQVAVVSNSLYYEPAANYHGPDSFTYTVNDGHGGTATATVNVAVTAVNDPPAALADSLTTPEDTAATVNVVANDSDLDGDTLAVTAVTQGAHGTVTFTTTNATYTPAANYNGPDSFTYTVNDAYGATATATVSVTVTPVNDPPVAVNDSVTIAEDSSVTAINVLQNDSDPDGDTLSVSGATQGAHGHVAYLSNSVTYSPDANYNGPDSFTYTVSDGQGGSASATVTVTVTPVNDPPVAVADNESTPEDTAITVDVLANDSDIDGDTLTVTGVTQGTHGTVTFTATNATYTPVANYNGIDAFTYSISDGNGGTATAAVSVNITPVNDAPTALADSVATNEDTPLVIAVLANDFDIDAETIILTGVTQGTRGTVTANANGTVTYSPNGNTFGVDTFTYSIRDAAGLTATATVTVNVVPVNDPPVAGNDSATVNEGGSVIITVLGNDTDIEGNALSVTAVSTPAHGTATRNADNTITYTPVATYSGPDSFTYTVSDGAATATATVNVVVKDVISNVALLATHSIWIQTGADVLSGDVIVNAAGTAPFLGSTELNLMGGATTATGWDVEANRVTIAATAVVASDVYSNQLFNSGTVSGAQYSPLSLPVFSTLPTLQTGTPNATDVSVATNGTRTLAPGTYRDLIVGKKATVTFTGGTYVFRSIQLSSEAKLFFSAAATVKVQQKISTSNLAQIKPGTGSTATPATVVFHVAGINGTGGGLAETPKAVEIGTDSTLSANFNVPNGTLWIKDRTVATGAFIAKDIQVNPDVQVTLASGW